MLSEPYDVQESYSEDCACEDLLCINGALQCRVCGTVWGVVYGTNKFHPWRRMRTARR